MKSKDLTWACCSSPVGKLFLLGDRSGLLHALTIVPREADPPPFWLDKSPDYIPVKDPAVHRAAIDQLGEYFSGQRTRFDLMWSFLHGTPFQCAVWSALADIPFGQVRSYGELAKTIGCPKGARAVGGACGANPLPLIIPCHRAVGSGGALGGFGYGLPMKKYLLALEQRH